MCIRLDMFNLMCFIVTVCFALLERENISGAEIGLMMTYATRVSQSYLSFGKMVYM